MPAGRKIITHYTWGSQPINTRFDRTHTVAGKSHPNSPNPNRLISSHYRYSGLSRLMRAAHDVNNSLLSLDYTSGGYDRFGRVVNQHWRRNSGALTRSQNEYTYDTGSNRTSRTMVGATGFDQAYVYDGLDRLNAMNQGILTGGSITSANLSQDWTLDQLGNWSEFEQGDGSTATLEQTRAHNEANEVGVIGATTGTNWVDPAHDAAGNMTTIPQPKNLAAGYSAKYDAWNRLVSLNDGSDDVQVNEYDGNHRRIVRDETGGSGDKLYPKNSKPSYYNENWQCPICQRTKERVEDGSGIDPDPVKQYAYHPYYIDAVACVWYDENHDDADIERYHFLHDANFNVVAITNTSHDVVERYHYSPYGEVTHLEANYSVKTTQASSIGNEFLYTGRRLDPETGLQYSRWRYYISPLGRWATRDPIGYAGSPHNLYEYVDGTPVNIVDPSGQWCESGTVQGCENACWARYNGFDPESKEALVAACREKCAKECGDKYNPVEQTLYKRLLALCRACNNYKGDASMEACERDAKRIASAIGNTLRHGGNEWGWNFRIKDERYKGQWCYDWAYGFEDAIEKLESPYFDVVTEFADTYQDGPVHAYIAIYINSPGCGSSLVYVDDSFANGLFVHNQPPVPTGYKQSKFLKPREMCNPVWPQWPDSDFILF
jgi:RHS repeat-associated protein